MLVSLYGVDVAHSSNVWIDAGGSFSFELLPEGNYQLTVFAPGYLYFTKNLHLAAGQSLTPNAALIAANSTISGHIIGPDGAPAAGVFVNASDLNGGGSGGETDANGDYVLTDVGATKYLVSVGGVGTTFEPQEKYATPAANGDATVDFVLTPRTTAYFSGNVLDQNGDWYVGTLCATLYSSKSKKALKDVAIWGQGWGEGTWSFDKVKPGSYTVEFRDCDDDPATKFDKVFLGGAKSYKDATFVTLTAGQDSFESVVTLTVRGNTK